jgi:hypothetical protein
MVTIQTNPNVFPMVTGGGGGKEMGGRDACSPKGVWIPVGEPCLWPWGLPGT